MKPSLKSRFEALSPQQKILGCFVLAIFIIAGMCYKFLLGNAAALAQEKLLSQVNEHLNGKITVGSMDVSFLGTINANQCAIYDLNNNLLGKSDQISIDFSLADLFAGRTDLQVVKRVTIEKPAIVINKQGEKWNWESIIKARSDQPFTFRGLVVVNQGAVSLESPVSRKFEAIDGNVAFEAYPSFSLDFKGKQGSSPFSAKGTWSLSGDGNLTIKAEKALLSELPLQFLDQAGVKITGGAIDTLTINVSQHSTGYKFSGEGTFSGVAANAAGYDVSQGAGSSKLNDNSVAIQNAALELNGQRVAFDGTVAVDDIIMLNLNVSANGFDPSVIAGPSFQGPITFQANIQGSPVKPQAKGQFSIPQGAFSSLAFSAANGNFNYYDGLLTLINTQARAWDGGLTINGTVIPSSKRYNLAITGSGIDSAMISNKDIKGRVAFDAAVSGQGAASLLADGSFRMGEGAFYDVPFLAMTGNFSKNGEKVNFTNVIVTTIAGSFAATGFNEGAAVKLQKSDTPITAPVTTPVNNVKDAINKSIADQLKKLQP